MTNHRLQQLSFLLLMLLASGASNAVAGAQQLQQPYEPPVMHFDAQGISLLDAIRITIENDPNVMLRDASVSLQQGVAQQFSGEFDVTFVGDFSYEYGQQELRESTKERERERRANLDEAITESEMFEQEARDLLAALQDARNSGSIDGIVDPVIKSQLLILDELIQQNINDPAARQELQNLREQIVNDNIDTTTAALSGLLEDLAENRLIRQQIGDVPKDELFNNGQMSLDFVKSFRNGIFIDPYVDFGFGGEDYRGKDRKEIDFGGKGIEDLYQFRIGFDVVVPLGRGLGRDATGASESAALVEVQASLLTLEHEWSISTLLTVLAYWDLRAAQESAEIAQRSVDLQVRLMEATRNLINAGDLAQAELSRVQASEARARARLEDSRRNLHQARVSLATAMGIGVTVEDDTLPIAGDPFPEEPAQQPLDDAMVDSLAQAALNLRRDLEAARTFEDAGRILSRGARLDQKPVIDVSAGTWAMALGETKLSEATDRWVGPSLSVGVRYEQPLGNNFFKGRYAQTQADLRQRQINAANLQRVITLGVIREARSVTDAIESLRQARASADAYQRVVASELQRFTAGDSSLIDTILTEDQQTVALLVLVRAHSEFARLVARLRFESGRLVSYSEDRSEITPETLTTIPVRREQ